MRFSLKSIALVSIAGVAAVAAVPAQAGPDEDILFRQLEMRTMGYSASVIFAITEGRSDQAQYFTALANQMATAAVMLKDSFEPNTVGQGRLPTRAKPNIWDNWNDFSGKLDKLAADTARVAELENAGDRAGAVKAMEAVFSNCKTCHDTYRTEK